MAPLGETQWNLITPFMGWSIKTQIAHLAYFDSTAGLAVNDPRAFKNHLEQVVQRRHVEDTNLKIRGNVMHEWMLIAQAFAGPPASGPKAGERAIVI